MHYQKQLPQPGNHLKCIPMTGAVFVIMSFSIYPAGIAGAIRFNKTDPAFYPFIFCTWLACLYVTSVYFISRQGFSTAPISNMYTLATMLLMNWQAKNWKLYKGYNNIYLAIQALCILAWFCDIHSVPGLQQIHLYSRLFFGLVVSASCFCICTGLILNYEKELLRSPVFLVCSAYLFFLAFKIPADVMRQLGTANNAPQQYIIDILLAFVHLPVNLLFLTAIICIPPRPRYIIL